MKKITEIDLNLIADECGLLNNINADSAIKNIDEAVEKYSQGDLSTIFNYLLTVTNDPDILTYLLKNIEQERDKSSLSGLLDLLLNKEYPINLRVFCSKIIAKYKDTQAVSSLLYCLNDKDENYKIRLACADALGKIGDRYAVTPLINVVQDEEEKSVYVRESAAAALGALGDKRAIDPLVSILESKKGFLDKFTFLKERAIEALGKLNLTSDRVFKALEHSLMDESSCVRINAIEALMDSGDDRAYVLIKEMLGDLNEEVKKNALIALYNMVGVEILNEVLQDELYCDFLKNEAREMIEEYENGDLNEE